MNFWFTSIDRLQHLMRNEVKTKKLTICLEAFNTSFAAHVISNMAHGVVH